MASRIKSTSGFFVYAAGESPSSVRLLTRPKPTPRTALTRLSKPTRSPPAFPSCSLLFSTSIPLAVSGESTPSLDSSPDVAQCCTVYFWGGVSYTLLSACFSGHSGYLAIYRRNVLKCSPFLVLGLAKRGAGTPESETTSRA